MKGRVQEVIDRYHQEGLNESKRRDLVRNLGMLLHPEAAAFLVQVLSAPEEGASVIEALDMLEIYDITEEDTYLAVGEKVRSLVESARNDITKIYAVKAACNFTDVPLMFPTILTVLFDAEAPSDARSNAFAFIRRIGDCENTRLVLTQLLQDPVFAQEAAELLTKWEARRK